MRVPRALSAALCAGLGLAACRAGGEAGRPHGATVSIGAIEWYVDYEAALAEARRRDAPLWAHFGEDPG